MSEKLSIYRSDGSQRFAIFALILVRNYGNRQSSGHFDQLDGQGTESARAAPNEYGIVFPNGVPAPSEQHPVCGSPHEHVTCGFGPTQAFRFRQALLGLDDGELGETAVIGFVSPNALARCERGIASCQNVRIGGVQLTAMRDDPIPHGNGRNPLANRPDDSRGIASSNVVIFRTTGFGSFLYDVYGFSQGCPNVVIVHSRGHDAEKDFSRSRERGRHNFLFKGVNRPAESRFPNRLREHRGRNRTELGQFAQFGKMGCLGHKLVLSDPFDNIRIRYFF